MLKTLSKGYYGPFKATRLIGRGHSGKLATTLRNYRDLDYSHAFNLIGTNHGDQVAQNIMSFMAKRHGIIVKELIRQKKFTELLKNIKILNSEVTSRIEPNELAKLAIDLDDVEGLSELDKTKRIGKLVNYLSNFDTYKLDKYVAQAIIDAGLIKQFSENLNKFFDLDLKIVLQLFEAGYGEKASLNNRSFKDVSIKKEILPYTGHAIYGIQTPSSIEDEEPILRIFTEDTMILDSSNADTETRFLEFMRHASSQITDGANKIATSFQLTHP